MIALKGGSGNGAAFFAAAGDGEALQRTIADAFEGARLGVGEGFDVTMERPGLLRPLGVSELSDGTLRYILLAAALLSLRRPN